MKRSCLRIVMIMLGALETGHVRADLFSRMLTVSNKSPETIYIATYYVQYADIRRTSPVLAILPNADVAIERPPFSWWADRFLYIAYSAEKLPEVLSEGDANSLSRVNIGSVYGRTFFITATKKRLRGMAWLVWYMRPLLSWATSFIKSVEVP